MEGEVIERLNTTWIFAVLLGMLLIFVMLKHTNYSRFQLFITAFWSARFRDQILRDEINFTSPLMIFLQGANIILLGLVAAFLFYFKIDEQHKLSLATYFALCSMGFLLFFLLKYGTIKTLGIIFHLESIASIYLFNFLLFSGALAILLFLPVVVLYFNPSLSEYTLRFIFILPAAFFTFRIIKNTLTVMRFNSSNFVYILLYICTLEILPVLIVSKWLLWS